MDNGIVTEIVNLIHRKYENVASPNFSFVQDMLSKRPYERVVREIGSFVKLTEDTDPNDDVSFVYILEKGKTQWSFRISMLGPYAVLMRVGATGKCEVLSSSTEDLSELERQIIKLSEENGIIVLDKETLSVHVALKLFNTEEGNTRVYQALFTDSDVLPWLG